MESVLNVYAPTNNTDHEVEIAFTGCFGDYNVTSCVRDSVLSALAVITAIICVVKLYHLLYNHHSLANQYIIFLCALVECILCTLEWLYLWKYAAIYVLQLLKIIQCVIVCRFYCSLAAQIYRKDNLLRFIPVVVVCFLLAVLAICISGWATLKSDREDCLAIQWILLSLAELLNAQLFLVSGVFVTKKLNQVRTLDAMRNAKKRELWGTIIVFEVAAITGVLHEALFKAFGDNGCQGILSTSASGFTAVYIAFKVIRWLLPIWAMAALFAIEENTAASQETLIVPSAPTGFRSPFYQFKQGTTTSPAGAQDNKRLMLPPFLQTAGGYGTINQATSSYESSDQFNIRPPHL